MITSCSSGSTGSTTRLSPSSATAPLTVGSLLRGWNSFDENSEAKLQSVSSPTGGNVGDAATLAESLSDGSDSVGEPNEISVSVVFQAGNVTGRIVGDGEGEKSEVGDGAQLGDQFRADSAIPRSWARDNCGCGIGVDVTGRAIATVERIYRSLI